LCCFYLAPGIRLKHDPRYITTRDLHHQFIKCVSCQIKTILQSWVQLGVQCMHALQQDFAFWVKFWNCANS
jgi:hypothetical protein